MGSWNGTCGVSQLSVGYKDDVVMFLMKKNEVNKVDYGGCVHSDNFYTPVSPAIFGKYDDFGRITNVQADERIIDSLYGKQDDYSNLGKLIDEQSTDKGLYTIIIHLGIYKEVIHEFGEIKDFFTEGVTLNHFIKGKMVEYLEAVRKAPPSSFNHKLDYNYFKRATDYSLRPYQDNNKYKDSISDDFLVNTVVDLLVFKHAMSISRKLWIPQAGQGSQNAEYGMVKIVGAFAGKKESDDSVW